MSARADISRCLRACGPLRTIRRRPRYRTSLRSTMRRAAAAASRRLLHSVAARQQAAPWLLPAAASGTWSVMQAAEGCRAAAGSAGSLGQPACPAPLPRQARGVATVAGNESGPMRQFRQAPRTPLLLPPPPTGGLPPLSGRSAHCRPPAFLSQLGGYYAILPHLQAGPNRRGHQGVRAGAVVCPGGAPAVGAADDAAQSERERLSAPACLGAAWWCCVAGG